MEECESKIRVYAALRHRVTKSETFGRFVRILAKEWVDTEKRKGQDGFQGGGNQHGNKIRPFLQGKLLKM